MNPEPHPLRVHPGLSQNVRRYLVGMLTFSPCVTQQRIGRRSPGQCVLFVLRGCRRDPLTIGRVQPRPPRPVYENRADPDGQEEAADAGSDDVKVVANGLDAVPEAAFEFGSVLNQGEELYDTDERRDEHSNAGQDDGVVQDRDVIARKRLGGVEGHHEGAIGGVEHAHGG